MKISKIILLLLLFSGISISQVWINQVNPSPGVLFSVYAYDANTAWISGEYGKVFFTSNGGNNWIVRSNPVFDSNNVFSVHAINPTTAFVVCNVNGGKVFRSVDKGASWQNVFSRANVTLGDIQFVNSQTGFVFGNPESNKYFIIKTINGGSTFDTLSVNRPNSPSPNSQIITNCTFLYQAGVGGPVLIWYGTSSGHVFYSTNTGVSWNFSIPETNISVRSITFSNPTTGFCGGDKPFITSSGGANWFFEPGIPNTGRYFSIENIAGQVFLSSGPSIYRSTNSGITFNLQFTNASKEDYRDMSFVNTASDNSLSITTGWGVTGDGVISHYTDPIGIIPTSTNIPEKFNLYQNYPNPFNPVTTISFDIAKKSNVKLYVSDILGKRVSLIYSGNVKAGTYKTEFDGSNFPSGIYFYSLQTEYSTITKKLILVK